MLTGGGAPPRVGVRRHRKHIPTGVANLGGTFGGTAADRLQRFTLPNAKQRLYRVLRRSRVCVRERRNWPLPRHSIGKEPTAKQLHVDVFPRRRRIDGVTLSLLFPLNNGWGLSTVEEFSCVKAGVTWVHFKNLTAA